MSFLTKKEVLERFSYNSETGEFTIIKSVGRRRIGETAGHVKHDGYRMIFIGGKRFYAHRLAWLVMTGEWPANEIDHINGDPGDNRWCNLRSATRVENMRNIRRTSRNSSGVSGVTWDKVNGKWVAQICVDYRMLHLGRFPTLEEARDARKQAEVKYGFHPNSGRAA